MNKLVQALAKIIREKIHGSIYTRSSARLESRFIFNGPPMELMEPLFLELTRNGGIEIHNDDGSST